MDAQTRCRVVPRVLGTIIPVLLAITSTSAAPPAPANLVAHVVGSTVTLTWTAPVGPVSGYILEAGSSSGLSDLARAAVGSAPAFVAPGVPAGTYFVRTRAFDGQGEGPPSNEVTVVVMGPCAAPPNAPFGLTSAVSGQVVSLTWASSGGCPPTNFVLQVRTAGLSNLALVNMGLTTSLSVAAPPGLYNVRVFAQNPFGTSGPSNEVIVQVTSQPSALCRLLTAVLTPAPYGDPDKALMTVQFPASAGGSAFFSFTSYRRGVGGQWIEYDWWRQQMVLPTGYSGRSELIDKPVGGAWRLDFRCDGQVIAQREGSG